MGPVNDGHFVIVQELLQGGRFTKILLRLFEVSCKPGPPVASANPFFAGYLLFIKHDAQRPCLVESAEIVET